jgi:hypothetical protein
MLQTADLTTCPGAQIASQTAVTAHVELSSNDDRNFTATIFPSAPDGIGVISGEISMLSLTVYHSFTEFFHRY